MTPALGIGEKIHVVAKVAKSFENRRRSKLLASFATLEFELDGALVFVFQLGEEEVEVHFIGLFALFGVRLGC